MISLPKLKFDFLNRRALFISANKMSVYHWTKGKLGDSFLFDRNVAGRDNFARYLQESANTPMTILLDVIEEEFRQDTIPHVFSSDRHALIERKKSRLFRDTDYIHVQKLGRVAEGRRDDRLLFTALTKQDVLMPWIELLDQYEVPLKGILSVPLLLQSYIKTWPDISDNALLVTMQSMSGLRQTFFKNKELQISRLSRLPRYGTKSYVPSVDFEVQKIQRYLNSLRLIPDDAFLDVYVFADKTILDELKESNISSPTLRNHYININRLPIYSRLSAHGTTPFSDQLLLGYLLETQPQNCYASFHELRFLKMRNMRYAMNTASVALLCFSILFSGLNFMNGLIYKQESASFKNKADYYQARYDFAKTRLPKTPVSATQIKLAVETAATLERYKSTPYEMLSFMGEKLEQFPNIKLDSLDWSFSIDPNQGMVISSDASPAKNNTDLPATDSTVQYYQIANIEAHIESFTGNYRVAIAMVAAFAETLRESDLAYSVSIESWPLDISSTATLQGNTQASDKTASFSLRAVLAINS